MGPACSSTPSAFTPVSRSVLPMHLGASAWMASQRVCQETPSWWAKAEIEVSNRASASVGQAIAGW